MENTLIFLAGVACAVVVEEGLRLAYRKASRKAIRTPLGRYVFRLRRKRRERIAQPLERRGMRIGALSFPWVVAAYGPFRHSDIESHFSPDEPSYPDEVEKLLEKVGADARGRAAAGSESPFNAEGYKLVRFHVSSRTEGAEDPRLVLHFAPTTYFRMLATELARTGLAPSGRFRSFVGCRDRTSR